MPPSSLRVRQVNARPPEPGRDYVLYWMVAARRPAWSAALDHALRWCRELRKPLVVFEPLRIDHPWASERFHAFVIQGMRDNARAFARTGVAYYPYVEPSLGHARGLLAALARRAAVIVTDEFPAFFLPNMLAAAARQVDVRCEAVDGVGLLPMRAAEKAYPSAAHFRRFVQHGLVEHLVDAPSAAPFERTRLPRSPDLSEYGSRWAPADAATLAGATLPSLGIDHEVRPVPMRGGPRAAGRAIRTFVEGRLDAYHERQNHPDLDATSRLSPYLHFGHVSAHQVFAAVARHEGWTIGRIRGRATGAREGWWGMRAGAEAFLDQLVVWRELAYNTCAFRPADYQDYDGLPAWARETLERHASDERPYLYGRAPFEAAATHDPLWNAAQRQLRVEGWCHNYLRMLWGKKILEWSRSPREALQTMIAIMNRWSLDGRDPSSYAGYAWTLGRYDRPWPERPIFGKVRAMSSMSAARKVRVREYLIRYGEHS